MSYYHIIIATERRTDPARLANPISQAVATGNMVDGMPEYVAGPAQLHSMGKFPVKPVMELLANPNQKPDDWDAEIDGDWPEQLLVKTGEVPNLDDPQFVMVAEWDGASPYVICHKGDYHARTMTYAGWPEITKEEHDALPHPDHL